MLRAPAAKARALVTLCSLHFVSSPPLDSIHNYSATVPITVFPPLLLVLSPPDRSPLRLSPLRPPSTSSAQSLTPLTHDREADPRKERKKKQLTQPSIWSTDSCNCCTGQRHGPEAERRTLSPGYTVIERLLGRRRLRRTRRWRRRGEQEEADGHKSRTCILSKLVRKKKEGGRVRVTEEQEWERLHSYHVFISRLSSRLHQPLIEGEREGKKERDLTRFKLVVFFSRCFQNALRN